MIQSNFQHFHRSGHGRDGCCVGNCVTRGQRIGTSTTVQDITNCQQSIHRRIESVIVDGTGEGIHIRSERIDRMLVST